MKSSLITYLTQDRDVQDALESAIEQISERRFSDPIIQDPDETALDLSLIHI